MSQPIRGQGSYLVFPISPKNASLVEDVEILLPVKFCWILFSGFRGKVENVSANHRPGRPFCFSDPPEKHKLGRGRWDIASYQAFSGFRGVVENVSANQSPGQPFCFSPIGLKNTNVVEGIESLLPVKFCWIPFSGFFREVENVSANQNPGRQFCFPFSPKYTNLVEGVEILLPIKFSLNSVQRFQRRSWKCLSQSEDRAAILFYPDWPEKHKRGRRHWELASCQVSLNSVQRFLQRRWKCLSQSEARAAILFFRSARKTQTSQRALRSCFLLSFVEFSSRFQRRSRKCLSQSEAGAAILFFRSARKTQTW